VKVLTGLAPLPVTNEPEMRSLTRQVCEYTQDAAIATNTALAEHVLGRARQRSRVVSASYIPAAAITGTATDFMTLIIRKRTALVPGTQVAMISLPFDTASTDNVAAWATKDMLDASSTLGAGTAFDLEAGDVLTIDVTKSTATGMTFPIGLVALELEPRT
jgi:hypothetical protein